MLISGAVWGGGDSFFSGAGPAGGTDFTVSAVAQLRGTAGDLGADLCTLAPGMPVEAVFVDVDDNLTLVQWRPKG